MSDPFLVVREFEQALAKYTGAPYVVTTTSCTMALLLAVKWHLQFAGKPVTVDVPKRTYVGVPMSILHAGGRVRFVDKTWQGAYRLDPLPIWDSARRFRRRMYVDDPSMFLEMVCVSFHWSKTLGIEQGGAILHAGPVADAWLRKARFDGRTAGVPADRDQVDVLGYHAYMSPETAAKGLMRLSLLKGDEPDLPNSDYPDLSLLPIFNNPS